jgi:hypothetical protein
MCQAAIRIHPANSVHQGTTTGKLWQRAGPLLQDRVAGTPSAAAG